MDTINNLSMNDLPNNLVDYGRANLARLLREINASLFLLLKSKKYRVETHKKEHFIDRMSITRANKTIACYSRDINYCTDSKHIPLFHITNNPYGKVPVIPRGVLQTHISYLEDLIGFGERNWEIEVEGNNKTFIITISIKQLAKKMLNKGWMSGGGFKQATLSNLESLAEIYAPLETTELNILASLRTIKELKSCLNYAYAMWMINFRKISFTTRGLYVYQNIEPLKKMARCCQQIEYKVYLFTSILQKLVKRINEFLEQNFFNERMTHAILTDIMESITLPTQDDSNWQYIRHIYSLNRNKLLSITEELIAKNKVKKDESSEIKDMYNSFLRSPIFPINSEHFPSIFELRQISQIYEELEKDWLDVNRYHNPETIIGKYPDWNISDGELDVEY